MLLIKGCVLWSLFQFLLLSKGNTKLPFEGAHYRNLVVCICVYFPHFDSILEQCLDSLGPLWSMPPQKYQLK